MDIDFDIGDGCFPIGDDGCLPGLGILVIGGAVVGLATVLMEHWIFAIALCCLAMTALFGWDAHRSNKKHKPHRLQELGAIICIIGFLAFSAYGIYEYQEKKQLQDAVMLMEEEAKAKRTAEAARIEQEKARVEQEKAQEARRIGAWGRFKRWAFGNENQNPEPEKPDEEK